VALLNDGILTGGQDGQIRTWRTQRYNPTAKPKLLTTVREHKGLII
jgi:hypothetical protein